MKYSDSDNHFKEGERALTVESMRTLLEKLKR